MHQEQNTQSFGLHDKVLTRNAQDFARETLESVELFAQPYGRGIMSKSDLENNYSLYGYMLEILSESGYPEEAKALELTFNETITAILAD